MIRKDSDLAPAIILSKDEIMSMASATRKCWIMCSETRMPLRQRLIHMWMKQQSPSPRCVRKPRVLPCPWRFRPRPRLKAQKRRMAWMKRPWTLIRMPSQRMRTGRNLPWMPPRKPRHRRQQLLLRLSPLRRLSPPLFRDLRRKLRIVRIRP